MKEQELEKAAEEYVQSIHGTVWCGHAFPRVCPLCAPRHAARRAFLAGWQASRAAPGDGERAAEEHCERIWQKERGMWRGEQWAQSREDFLAGFQARSPLVELLRRFRPVIQSGHWEDGVELLADVDAALKGEK